MGEFIDFSREVPFTDPREIWSDGAKWKDFFLILQRAKEEGASTLVVGKPEMLGDTWREVILNLSAIASAGLTLEIKDASGVVKAELDCSSGVEVDLKERVIFEKKDPLFSNAASHRQKRFGPYILRAGKEPPVLLHSSGPDEIYCQAELLLMAEWEEFKPTGKGREVQGTYLLTGGTVEWFLSKYADKPSHGVLEDYCRKIRESGFAKFIIPRGVAQETVLLVKNLKNALKTAPPEAIMFNKDLVRKTKESIERLGQKP